MMTAKRLLQTIEKHPHRFDAKPATMARLKMILKALPPDTLVLGITVDPGNHIRLDLHGTHRSTKTP